MKNPLSQYIESLKEVDDTYLRDEVDFRRDLAHDRALSTDEREWYHKCWLAAQLEQAQRELEGATA